MVRLLAALILIALALGWVMLLHYLEREIG